MTTEVDDHELVADCSRSSSGSGSSPPTPPCSNRRGSTGAGRSGSTAISPPTSWDTPSRSSPTCGARACRTGASTSGSTRQSALRAGLKYLEKTGDTLFDRASLRSRSHALTSRELVERLTSGSASAKLAALWQIKKDGPTGEEQVDAVLSLLEERDEYLRTEAAWVVGAHALAPDRSPGLLYDALRKPRRGDACHGGLGWASSPRRPRRPSHGSSLSSRIPKTRSS